MASILKVDQLQKTDGSTPTPTDVGLNMAGNAVGFAMTKQSTNRTGISASSWISTGMFVDYTPKFANSILLVEAVVHWDTDQDASNGLVFTIYRDSTNMAQGEDYSALAFEYLAAGAGNDSYFRTPMAAVTTSGATTPTRFTVYCYRWAPAAVNIFPHAGTSYIKVTEIAQ